MRRTSTAARARVSARPAPGRGRRGLTLLELVLASGLLAVVVVAVLALLDGSLSLWKRAELRRGHSEQASAVLELLDRDLRALEAGERGDLVADWVLFDTTGDGLGDQAWPRLRLVRQASAAELAQLAGGAGVAPLGPGLIEVCWAITPAGRQPDERAEGVLWRGARPLEGELPPTFFEPGFFARTHEPPPGALDEVCGGLLWLGLRFATQATIVHEGWSIGSELADASAAWDAWGKERMDFVAHRYNQLAGGMPRAYDQAALPRRVRLEIELERPIDRRERTRTSHALEATEVSFTVDDQTRLPFAEDAYLKLGGEWMRLRSVSGRRVTVERGRRGTEARPHPAGTLVHFGPRMVREVPVEAHREDWKL